MQMVMLSKQDLYLEAKCHLLSANSKEAIKVTAEWIIKHVTNELHLKELRQIYIAKVFMLKRSGQYV